MSDALDLKEFKEELMLSLKRGKRIDLVKMIRVSFQNPLEQAYFLN